jgi:hypothetical protein
MQDEIVGWVQGLAAHIDKYDQSAKSCPPPDATSSGQRPSGDRPGQ